MRPPVATIDLGALRHNLAVVRSRVADARILAVVKADAYGHGLLRAADAFRVGADAFACSGVMEAVALREHGISQPVVALLGFQDEEELRLASRHRIDLTVHCVKQLAMLETARLVKPVRIWLKFNTGMNRLGFPIERAQELLAAISALPAVLPGPVVMTHLACADEPGTLEVGSQIRRFDDVRWLPDTEQSIANSAGVLAWPESHRQWVRPGLILYGCSPFEHCTGGEFGLKPAMTIDAPVIAVNRIPAGNRVGYGGAWEAKADGWLATVAAGYGDGYPRHARNGTPVLINGRRYGLAGRVSMDLVTVDLGQDESVAIGDTATLWGAGLPVEEVAASASTICYELLCSAGSRIRTEAIDSLPAMPAVSTMDASLRSA